MSDCLHCNGERKGFFVAHAPGCPNFQSAKPRLPGDEMLENLKWVGPSTAPSSEVDALTKRVEALERVVAATHELDQVRAFHAGVDAMAADLVDDGK